MKTGIVLMGKGGEVGLRLIDADALKARIMEDVPGFLDGGSSITKAFILAMLATRNATPTIDAVPVILCKDCKYWLPMNRFDPDYHPGRGECELNCWVRDFDWFCGDGKRRDGSADQVSDRVPDRMGHHGDCSEDRR